MKQKTKSNQKQIISIKTFDWSYFLDKSHFEDDWTQNYLVVQAVLQYFEALANSSKVTARKSKDFSEESIKNSTSDNSLTLNEIRIKLY